MYILNIHKQVISSHIFVLLFIFHKSNGDLFKRSPELEKGQNHDHVKEKIISEEDPNNPGAGARKPDKMPHVLSRRQSLGSFSRLFLCKWLSPREEMLSLPMCTRIGDFPYLNECRVFRHCINVGSTTIKACCPVGSHFDHILRECVHAKDARCLTRDLEDQFMDSAFYDESAVDLPHTDLVHADDYVDVLHDDIVDVGDVDDDSETLEESFEVINPSVLANNDKSWKYYPAPPHLYPGAFWSHNAYTGKMEPARYGYAMPIWMSYNVEPIQKIRAPRRKRPKPWQKPWMTLPSRGNGQRRSTEEYDPKAGLGEEGASGEGDNEDSDEKKKIDWSGETFDENDKSPRPTSSPIPVTPPMITAGPFLITTPSLAQLVIPVIPVQPPAPPPPFIKPATPLPPVELIKFTTKRPLPPVPPRESDEDNGFEVGNSVKTTPKSPSVVPPLIDNQKGRAPVAGKSNEPPPPIMGFPKKSSFDDSSEEDKRKKKRSEDSKDHDVHQVVTTSVAPRIKGNDEGATGGGQAEKQLSVLPDFENSNEQQDTISNGDILIRNNNFGRSNQGGVKKSGGGGEEKASQPSPKKKRQVPMVMVRRRVIPRRRPDYFYYNY